MNEQLKIEAMELVKALSKARHRELAERDEWGHQIVDQERVSRLARLVRTAADRWRRRAGVTRAL